LSEKGLRVLSEKAKRD